MPLKLSPMLPADIPAFAAIDEAAMAHWPLAQAMSVGSPLPRQELIEQWTRQDWGKDPAQTWLKAVDEDTGEMVAAALWRVVLEGGEEGKGRAGGEDVKEANEVKEQVPTPVEAQGVAKNLEKEDSQVERAAPGAIGEAMKRSWEEFRSEYFASQPYVNLQILLTHPRHQRRGAGTLLTKWGCEIADSKGLMTVLTSSEAGLRTYLKCGFEVVREWDMDMRRYGADGVEIRRWMVRRPRGREG